MEGSIRLAEYPSDTADATYSWSSGKDYPYVDGDGSCVVLSGIYKDAGNWPLVTLNATGEEVDVETG